MQQTKTVYSKRSPSDRRTPVDRRVLDMGPEYPGRERRKGAKDSRRGWEDRHAWERVSKWSSSPIDAD